MNPEGVKLYLIPFLMALYCKKHLTWNCAGKWPVMINGLSIQCPPYSVRLLWCSSIFRYATCLWDFFAISRAVLTKSVVILHTGRKCLAAIFLICTYQSIDFYLKFTTSRQEKGHFTSNCPVTYKWLFCDIQLWIFLLNLKPMLYLQRIKPKGNLKV